MLCLLVPTHLPVAQHWHTEHSVVPRFQDVIKSPTVTQKQAPRPSVTARQLMLSVTVAALMLRVLPTSDAPCLGLQRNRTLSFALKVTCLCFEQPTSTRELPPAANR